MTKHRHTRPRFAICIKTYTGMLTPLKIYQVLPDERAERDGLVRVIDNEGEDYLYPKDYFVFVELPNRIRQVLLRTRKVLPEAA